MKSPTTLMLSTLAVAVGGAFAALPVHADGHHTDQLNAQFAPSLLTRAEVRAELEAARRAGALPRNEREAARALEASFKPLRTRAEVRAEAREANRLGLLSPQWVNADAAPTLPTRVASR